MGLFKMTEDLAKIETGSIVQCDGISGQQKNWMPLVVDDILYFVVETHPLTIAKLDVFGCTIYQRGSDVPQSLQLVSVSPHPPLKRTYALRHAHMRPAFLHKRANTYKQLSAGTSCLQAHICTCMRTFARKVASIGSIAAGRGKSRGPEAYVPACRCSQMEDT